MSNQSSPRTSALQTFLIGFMALLPLILTVSVIVWLAGVLEQFLGPKSIVGSVLTSLGLSFVDSTTLAYLSGAILVLAVVYGVGILLQRGLRSHLASWGDRLIRRVPLVGNIYDLASRFVAMFERKDDPALQSMTPVWCFFGGEGGTAVLALLPSPEPLTIGGHRYLGILVPSAPVPVGGGLLYVPVDWVKPADFGMDGLTSIYVSMGVTAPSVVSKAGNAAG